MYKLPPFKDFPHCTLKEKQMAAFVNNAKVVQLSRFCQQFCSHALKTNIDSTCIMIDLADLAANATITELNDAKKTAFKYLSDSGTEYSLKCCLDDTKTAIP